MLGETITYKITVTNDGNLTITNIVVTDELTGDEWTIDSLAPGESQEFTAEYVVTEADILAGEVLNVATATGDSPDPDEPDVPVDPGEDPEPTEDPNGHITIEKEVVGATEGYVKGDTVEYKITVTNDGNLTITNIVVTDELTGDEWTIDSLAPGASKTFSVSYIVTVDDVVNGSILNVATVAGTASNADEVEDDASVEVTTTKIAIEITAATDEKEYDGTALTNDGYELTDGELLDGDAIESVTVTGSQTEAGSSPNVPSEAKIVDADGNDVTAAYDITYKEGTLTVTKTKKELKVVSKDGEWMYDGTEHTKREYTVTFGDESYEVTIADGETSGTVTLSTGDVVTITPDDSAKVKNFSDGGTGNNTFTWTVENEDSYANKTEEYGDLKILKRKVILTSADGSKWYDGTPLKKNEQTDVTVSGDGFVDSEGATYDITGSQTAVGSSPNKFTYTLNAGTLAENYEITTIFGTLTVLKNLEENVPLAGYLGNQFGECFE